VADLLETNFQKSGLGHTSNERRMNNDYDNDNDTDFDDDKDDDEAVVTAFLKEETNKIETPKPNKPFVKPIAVNWSPPVRKQKAENTVEKKMNTPGKNLWGVQFGTYKSLKEAKSKARKTLSILKSGEVSTPRVTKGKKSFYGARLLGITKEEAETVCKKYALNGNECRLLASY
jgi:hypothetical protein